MAFERISLNLIPTLLNFEFRLILSLASPPPFGLRTVQTVHEVNGELKTLEKGMVQ
jgi:hypothetical protein